VVPIFAKKCPFLGVFETKTARTKKCETLEALIYKVLRVFGLFLVVFFIF